MGTPFCILYRLEGTNSLVGRCVGNFLWLGRQEGDLFLWLGRQERDLFLAGMQDRG